MLKAAILTLAVISFNASAYPGFNCTIECTSSDEVNEFSSFGKARATDSYSACEFAETIAKKNALKNCEANSPAPEYCEVLPETCHQTN